MTWLECASQKSVTDHSGDNIGAVKQNHMQHKFYGWTEFGISFINENLQFLSFLQ